MCLFFFQAEDGIRDWSVTGVQTCALPISVPPVFARLRHAPEPVRRKAARRHEQQRQRQRNRELRRKGQRSEERRVGKECRTRVSTYSQKTQHEYTWPTVRLQDEKQGANAR